MSTFFLKNKLKNKVKKASDKTEAQQNKITCVSLEKIWDQSIIGLDNN